MRDTLTALAGVVILILVAALAAPPFIDWAGQRDLIDRTVSASLGVPARSEGRISVRLLPSPDLQFERLQLGEAAAARPALAATNVQAELALTPLLKGEFRFTRTAIERAELRLPVAEGDAVLIPSDFAEGAGSRDLVIEDLAIGQALVTTIVPATGRTDQFQAENVRLKTTALAGPWQLEGATRGVPFRVATGAFTREGGLTLKVTGGGEAGPRFEADARLVLKPVGADPARAGTMRPFLPETEGTARLVVGTGKTTVDKTNAGKTIVDGAAAGIPYTLGGRFKARGALAQFEGVNAEIDPAGQRLRLTGAGHVDLRAWRAGLVLESRRINLDALLAAPSGQATLARFAAAPDRVPIMLDLDLRAEGLTLGAEDWADVAMRGTLDRSGGLLLRALSGTLAPRSPGAAGGARIEASGQIEIAPAPRFSGHVEIDAPASDDLGRAVRRILPEAPGLDLVDGRPLQFSGDVTAAAQETALRALRLQLGGASLSGSARFARPDPAGRGRLEAELAVQDLDIAELPAASGLLAGLEGNDLALRLTGRGVRYGPAAASPGRGAIEADIQSDGAALVVDRLEVDDLAGANATLSGRLAPDGSGRIAGRVAAPVAAPLLALVERIWLAEARRVPAFLRAGALDLAVSLEREGEGAAQPRHTLRTAAQGRAGENSLDFTLLTRARRVERLDAVIAGPSAARWFGREDIAGLRQPARLTLAAARQSGGALDWTASGTLAGLTLTTAQPVRIAPEQTLPERGLSERSLPEVGAFQIVTADLAPFLALAGGMRSTAALPVNLSVAFAPAPGEAAPAQATVTGSAAGARVAARFTRGNDGTTTGTLDLDRLSLPALAAALVLPEAGGGFAPAPDVPRVDLALTVARLDLGRGFIATGAGFGLALEAGSLGLRDLRGDLAGGRISGSATLARRGEEATISGEGTLSTAAIGTLAAGAGIEGRFSTRLRYAATGADATALAANLGGSGEVTLDGLTLPGADPAAIDRALARALGEDDPLREGRVPALLAEEFGRAALVQREPATFAATLAGGTLRSAPFALALGPARWSGSFALDLNRARLDARGTLASAQAPRGWTGPKPAVGLSFTGPLAAPRREVDAGPLGNGLAALVLQRELEKIELADADQAERQRRRARVEMDKARAAAIKAAQDRVVAEEAARQARQRAQQAAAEEEARRAREGEATDSQARPQEIRPQEMRPLDIRPPGAN